MRSGPAAGFEPAGSAHLLRRGALSVSALLLAYALAVYAAAYLSLHPRRVPVTEWPDARGLKYEERDFPSAADGIWLRGWYIPAEGSPRGIVIFCHGRDGNRSNVLNHALFLHRAGFALFSFDFRAYGDSGGSLCTVGYREVEDALGAIAYMRSRKDIGHSPIGLFGISMGAAVALQATARCADVRCVVADSPFATLDSAVRQRFTNLLGPVAVLFRAPVEQVGEWMTGRAAIDVSPLKAMPAIAPRPILLIHGTNDQICPVGDSRLLAAAAAPGTANLWIVNGAGHIGSYDAEPAAYEKRVTAFFLKNLIRKP